MTRRTKKSYPLFKEATSYTMIPFWKNMLSSCSNGLFPKGITVAEELMVKVGKTVKKYPLPSKPEELCKMFIHICKHDLNLGPQDVKKVVEESRAIPKSCSLADIRNKAMRFRLIYNFAEDYVQYFKLDSNEVEKLVSAVYTGIILKIITTSDIKINNYRITNMEGIEYIAGKFELDLDRIRIFSTTRSSSSQY